MIQEEFKIAFAICYHQVLLSLYYIYPCRCYKNVIRDLYIKTNEMLQIKYIYTFALDNICGDYRTTEYIKPPTHTYNYYCV